MSAKTPSELYDARAELKRVYCDPKLITLGDHVADALSWGIACITAAIQDLRKGEEMSADAPELEVGNG